MRGLLSMTFVVLPTPWFSISMMDRPADFFV
jgi:hypothetical protein